MPAADRTEIRRTRRDVVLGTVAGWIMRIWGGTLRFRLTDRGGLNTREAFPGPVILALWHNRIFTIPPMWGGTGGRFRQVSVLTSASNDGSILESAMRVFGVGAIRGSSSRRAVAALVGMKRALRDGISVCITPDGPRGPRYVVQPGLVKLAESAGVPIIPLHARYSSAWRVKSWDRLVIPKPFSRVEIEFGQPITIARGLGDAAFEAERVRVEAILLAGADDA